MRPREIQKQVSIFFGLSDWKAIRDEAIRLRVPITEVCRRWMRPALHSLRDRLHRGEGVWKTDEEMTREEGGWRIEEDG